MYNDRRFFVLNKGTSMATNCTIKSRVWRSVLIVVAICALTSSLATRFYVIASPDSHVLKSVEGNSVDPKHQHLDRDASQWVAPESTFTFMEWVASQAPLLPVKTVLPTKVFFESLYDRPPPFIQFL
jgi:hypothetical protein